MQLPLTAVRAGEVTTAMREKLQTVDGGTWILVQPLFFYESLWCLLVLLVLMMLLRKSISGRDLSEISGRLWSGKSSAPVVPHR